jgi:hypothetical protein
LDKPCVERNFEKYFEIRRIAFVFFSKNISAKSQANF